MSDHGPGVLGIFEGLSDAASAIERLREQGLKDLTVFSPAPRHELEHALEPPQSPIRLFTLVGGLTGAATGFALTIGTSLDWPLVTGGKPIISLPPFVIIAFELTILFGALATVAGLFITARLPKTRPTVVYDPSFSAGRFGIYAEVPPEQTNEARAALQESGATEIRERPEEAEVETL